MLSPFSRRPVDGHRAGTLCGPRKPMSTEEVLGLHDRLSNWGRWGPDDQLGALNFITAEVTALAASGVLSGQTVSCARPLATQPRSGQPHASCPPHDRHGHRGLRCRLFRPGPAWLFNQPPRRPVSRISRKGSYYNGYEAETVTAHGAAELGIHHLRSGIITQRGVLVDVPATRGIEALKPGEPIFPEDLESAELKTGVTIRTGDALLIRTGRWRWREFHGSLLAE